MDHFQSLSHSFPFGDFFFGHGSGVSTKLGSLQGLTHRGHHVQPGRALALRLFFLEVVTWQSWDFKNPLKIGVSMGLLMMLMGYFTWILMGYQYIDYWDVNIVYILGILQWICLGLSIQFLVLPST